MKRAVLKRVAHKTERSTANTADKPINLGSPIWVVFVTIVIFLVSQILVAPVVLIVGKAIFAPHSSLNLDDSAAAQFFFILAAEAAAALIAIRVVKNRRLSLATIGLGRHPLWRDLKLGALGFAAVYGLLIITSIIISIFAPNINSEQQNIGFNHISTHADNVFAFISLVILPPLGEEILVRGYLFSGLRMAWRFWPAAVVTSLFFGIAHLEFGSGGPLVWAAAIDTCLLSVILCFLRERTGALYAGMLVHMVNNLIAFGVHFK
jgi:membrane protease YdiL (CAAX protease family)